MIGPDGLTIDPSSSQQLQTFLFGRSTNAKTKEPVERCRTFKVLREELPKEAMEAYRERDEYERTMAMEAGQEEGEEMGEDKGERGEAGGRKEESQATTECATPTSCNAPSFQINDETIQ